MEKLDAFCERVSIENLKKAEQAVAFIWFYAHVNGVIEVHIDQICDTFDQASLPLPNKSRLRDELKSLRSIRRGKQEDTFALTRDSLKSFDENYGDILGQEVISVADVAGIDKTPFLSPEEIEAAQRMAELFVIIHCYENSARKLIQNVLEKKLGENWWDVAANSTMKNNAKQLKQKGNYSAYLSKNHHLRQERPKLRMFAICSRPRCGVSSPKQACAATCSAFGTMPE